MQNIHKSELIAAPIDRVWAALTDAQTVGTWMKDTSVEIDLQISGEYKIFSGSIAGLFLQILPPTELAYTWKPVKSRRRWRDSVVEWKLAPEGDGTRVNLVHRDLPNQTERDSHDDGWDIFWLWPMKAWLEGSK
jgi:uncharacterized protein YndB with AHSA1/START domain